MTGTTVGQPREGRERVRSGRSGLVVLVVLFLALAPSLAVTRVIGEHETWSFWDSAAHVVVLTLIPAAVIGLIRLVEIRHRARKRAAAARPPRDGAGRPGTAALGESGGVPGHR